jgi:hypothetical protein
MIFLNVPRWEGRGRCPDQACPGIHPRMRSIITRLVLTGGIAGLTAAVIWIGAAHVKASQGRQRNAARNA